jgi:SAM-dependent methyltransferase
MKNPLMTEARLQELAAWETEGRPSVWSEPPTWNDQPKFQRAVELLKAHDVVSVLEVGCFTGYWLRGWAKAGGHGWGIDLMNGTLVKAKTAAQEDGVGDRCEFYVMAARDLDPLKMGPVDAVVFLDSLEHSLDWQRDLAKAEACVKLGGWVLLHLPLDYQYTEAPSDEHVMMFTSADLQEAFGLKPGLSLEMSRDEHGRPTMFVLYQVNRADAPHGGENWSGSDPLSTDTRTSHTDVKREEEAPV